MPMRETLIKPKPTLWSVILFVPLPTTRVCWEEMGAITAPSTAKGGALLHRPVTDHPLARLLSSDHVLWRMKLFA